METKYKFVRVSGNSKTGPIPTTMTSNDSCPDSCPLKKNGCYAESGPITIHWRKLHEKGETISSFVQHIKALPKRLLWRHNTAGDLAHIDGNIDQQHLNEIVVANKYHRGFTYTHHKLNEHNLALIKDANKRGFTINVSLDNINMIADAKKHDVPMVCIVPSDFPKTAYVGETRVVVCPAQTIKATETREAPTCATCELCQKRDRDYVIGFYPHGRGVKKVELIAKG